MSDDRDVKPENAPAKAPFRARARRKLTGEVLDRICKRVAGGMDLESACALENVTTRSLRDLAKNHADVAEDLATAKAKRAEWYRKQIVSAKGEGWKRYAWLAERFHRDTFAKPTEHREISGPDGAAVQTNVRISIAQALEGARKESE